MNPTNELGLPPGPPLPPDVRERALRAVLDEMDTPVPSRSRHPLWAPLLTAAAVALVAIAVAAAVTLSGAHPDGGGPPAPATGPSAAPTIGPLPQSERPPPTSDTGKDTALLRCATAVAGSSRAAEYPPTSTWTSPELISHRTPLENELVIDNSFGCLVTPTTVVVTGTTGTPLGGVQVVRLTADELVLLNPQGRRFTIGPPQRRLPDSPGPVMFYPLDAGVSLGDLWLTVQGEDGYNGPVPEPEPALTVVDRPRPTRDANAPDSAELADCIGRFPPQYPLHPDLWIPVGRHDVGGTAPPALVARIGDLAAGFCVQDPAGGPNFEFWLLPAASDRPQVVTVYRGSASAVLLTAPAGITRMEISPENGATGPTACTIVDGLAMCTLDDPPGSGVSGQWVVVTAVDPADPDGIEVYRG